MALNDIIILLKVVAFSSLRQLLDHLKGKAREAISTRSLTAGRVLLPCCEQRMCRDSADNGAGRTCTAQVSAWTDRTLQQKLEQTSPQQAWSYQRLPLQGDPVGDASAALLPLPRGWAEDEQDLLGSAKRSSQPPPAAHPGGGTEPGWAACAWHCSSHLRAPGAAMPRSGHCEARAGREGEPGSCPRCSSEHFTGMAVCTEMSVLTPRTPQCRHSAAWSKRDCNHVCLHTGKKELKPKTVLRQTINNSAEWLWPSRSLSAQTAWPRPTHRAVVPDWLTRCHQREGHSDKVAIQKQNVDLLQSSTHFHTT